MSHEPSLLAFLLARLDEDVDAILRSTPLLLAEHPFTGAFMDRFLDRRSALTRIAADRSIVVRVVEAMEAEQGPPRVATGPQNGAATALGSQVLKVMAFRYATHPQYDQQWAPDGGIGPL